MQRPLWFTVKEAGGEAVACPGSVTVDGFAEQFVGTAIDSFGGLDIIVNNDGYTWDGVIQNPADEQWDAILDVHLKAPFRILRAAQPVISAAAKREVAEGRTVHRKVSMSRAARSRSASARSTSTPPRAPSRSTGLGARPRRLARSPCCAPRNRTTSAGRSSCAVAGSPDDVSPLSRC